MFLEPTNCSGVRKLFFLRIPQIFLWIPQSCLFLEQFWAIQGFSYCPRNPKQQRRSKNNSNVANSAIFLFLTCCKILLLFTKYTVWPRNVDFFFFFLLHSIFSCYYCSIDLKGQSEHSELSFALIRSVLFVFKSNLFRGKWNFAEDKLTLNRKDETCADVYSTLLTCPVLGMYWRTGWQVDMLSVASTSSSTCSSSVCHNWVSITLRTLFQNWVFL